VIRLASRPDECHEQADANSDPQLPRMFTYANWSNHMKYNNPFSGGAHDDIVETLWKVAEVSLAEVAERYQAGQESLYALELERQLLASVLHRRDALLRRNVLRTRTATCCGKVLLPSPRLISG
jgi:hypothetical protein